MTTQEQPEVATTRPALLALAEKLGIQSSYVDQTGEALRVTSDATREALLEAMGYDVGTEEAAAEALRTLRTAARHRWIEPVRVVRQRSRALSRVMVRVPSTRADSVEWTLTLRTEEGMEAGWTGTTSGG